MKEYKIIVKYDREGKKICEPWFIRAENGDDAIKLIENRFHELNDHLFVGAKDATFSIESPIDVLVTVTHKNLITSIGGFAREAVNENGTSGVLIFIPTGVGKKLIDLIKVVD
jgi:hypothetical protein